MPPLLDALLISHHCMPVSTCMKTTFGIQVTCYTFHLNPLHHLGSCVTLPAMSWTSCIHASSWASGPSLNHPSPYPIHWMSPSSTSCTEAMTHCQYFGKPPKGVSAEAGSSEYACACAPAMQTIKSLCAWCSDSKYRNNFCSCVTDPAPSPQPSSPHQCTCSQLQCHLDLQWWVFSPAAPCGDLGCVDASATRRIPG